MLRTDGWVGVWMDGWMDGWHIYVWMLLQTGGLDGILIFIRLSPEI